LLLLLSSSLSLLLTSISVLHGCCCHYFDDDDDDDDDDRHRFDVFSLCGVSKKKSKIKKMSRSPYPPTSRIGEREGAAV